MALLGQGAVVIWGDLGSLEPAAHDDWHSHEHLPERVGIPGFLRGRRALSSDGSAPQIMAIYEVQALATLTSPAYLERLNAPTPWSARTMASMRQLSRTLCRVASSHGAGLGAESLTVAFSPQPDRAAALRQWLAHDLLPSLVAQPGLTGAHLLEREPSAEPPPSEEQRLRRLRDVEVDAVLLVEGYDAGTLDRLAATALSPAQLIEHGAAATPVLRRWRLAHVMTGADAAPR